MPPATGWPGSPWLCTTCSMHKCHPTHTQVPNGKDVTPPGSPCMSPQPRGPLGMGDLPTAPGTALGSGFRAEIWKLQTFTAELTLILQQQVGKPRNAHALSTSCGCRGRRDVFPPRAGVTRALGHQPTLQAPADAERLINPLGNLAQFAVFWGLVLFCPPQGSTPEHRLSSQPCAQGTACGWERGGDISCSF